MRGGGRGHLIFFSIQRYSCFGNILFRKAATGEFSAKLPRVGVMQLDQFSAVYTSMIRGYATKGACPTCIYT